MPEAKKEQAPSTEAGKSPALATFSGYEAKKEQAPSTEAGRGLRGLAGLGPEAKKEQAPSTEAATTPELEIREPEDGIYDVYSNFINLNWTPNDVRLRFGQLIPVSRGKLGTRVPMVVEERVAVTLTWAEVKFLRDLLAQLVAKYEEKNGEIKPGEMFDV